MKEKKSYVLSVLLVLASLAGSARAASNMWLHVTVDESDGAKVRINLPLALAERALPMLPFHEELHWRHGEGGHGVELEEARQLWAEIKNSPDMTYVTVDDDETVKVWKENDFVYVEVRNEDGGEEVDVQVPVEVVDALLAGEEIDLAAAFAALAERGGGNLVTVRDRQDNVRVWIDDTPEAK